MVFSGTLSRGETGESEEAGMVFRGFIQGRYWRIGGSRDGFFRDFIPGRYRRIRVSGNGFFRDFMPGRYRMTRGKL